MSRAEELDRVAEMVGDFIRAEGAKRGYCDLNITVKLDAQRPAFVERSVVEKIRISGDSRHGNRTR